MIEHQILNFACYSTNRCDISVFWDSKTIIGLEIRKIATLCYVPFFSHGNHKRCLRCSYLCETSVKCYIFFYVCKLMFVTLLCMFVLLTVIGKRAYERSVYFPYHLKCITFDCVSFVVTGQYILFLEREITNITSILDWNWVYTLKYVLFTCIL